MRIEEYFERVRKAIDDSAIARSSTITLDKRSSHEGFVRGEIYFPDDSILHIREYVDVEISVERLAYSYHYLDASQQLIFRYDNTGHHKKLNLATYPHHKHLGSEDNIIAAAATDLAAVLREIEALIPFA